MHGTQWGSLIKALWHSSVTPNECHHKTVVFGDMLQILYPRVTRSFSLCQGAAVLDKNAVCQRCFYT